MVNTFWDGSGLVVSHLTAIFWNYPMPRKKAPPSKPKAPKKANPSAPLIKFRIRVMIKDGRHFTGIREATSASNMMKI